MPTCICSLSCANAPGTKQAPSNSKSATRFIRALLALSCNLIPQKQRAGLDWEDSASLVWMSGVNTELPEMFLHALHIIPSKDSLTSVSSCYTNFYISRREMSVATYASYLESKFMHILGGNIFL